MEEEEGAVNLEGSELVDILGDGWRWCYWRGGKGGGRQMERKEDLRKHGKFERMSNSIVERVQAYGGGGACYHPDR